MDRVRSPVVWAGILLAIASFFVYWLSNRAYDAGRGDLFYLADAFLHGRMWLDFVPGPFDIIQFDDRVYVPFAPFPAIVLMPLVAAVGAVTADQWETGINAFLASMVVLLAWWVSGRIGATKLRDRFAMAVLLGFSTQIWWVTTRGGVWHTGHLIATILTMLLLAEMFGRKRAFLMGLLVGAAFLTRAPVAFAAPAVALWLIPSDADRRPPPRIHRLADRRVAVALVGVPGPRPAARPRVLLLVQRRAFRRPARVGVRDGDAAGVAPGPA